jgi:pectinesterase
LLQSCDILGHQDTLFADAGTSRFRNCRLAGSVDFVFGAGKVLVENSRIVSRFRPGKERQGYVAAPSTRADDAHGIAFRDCRLEREPEVPDATVALGRAWRPTRTFADGRYGDPAVLGKAVFIDCWMDAHIAPEGWDPMAYTARDGSRVMLEPGEARFFESGSSGPGARAHARRRQLPPQELQRYPSRMRPAPIDVAWIAAATTPSW